MTGFYTKRSFGLKWVKDIVSLLCARFRYPFQNNVFQKTIQLIYNADQLKWFLYERNIRLTLFN